MVRALTSVPVPLLIPSPQPRFIRVATPVPPQPLAVKQAWYLKQHPRQVAGLVKGKTDPRRSYRVRLALAASHYRNLPMVAQSTAPPTRINCRGSVSFVNKVSTKPQLGSRSDLRSKCGT